MVNILLVHVYPHWIDFVYGFILERVSKISKGLPRDLD